MNLLVQRGLDDGVSILGEMFINGNHQCYTLEPSASRPQYPAIPAGTFPIQLLESPRFNEITPHIQNVPNRSFIEIHPGNDAANTEGCTLVGETESRDWVGSSRAAFLKLMAVLTSTNENITITFQDINSNTETV